MSFNIGDMAVCEGEKVVVLTNSFYDAAMREECVIIEWFDSPKKNRWEFLRKLSAPETKEYCAVWQHQNAMECDTKWADLPNAYTNCIGHLVRTNGDNSTIVFEGVDSE